MKPLFLTAAFLLVCMTIFSQIKDKTDPKEAQVDSLKQTNQLLSLKLDSVSKELVKYIGVYDAIREKVLHYRFDPTRSAYLIDSLKASRDSTTALLAAVPKSKTASDSLYLMLRESSMLRARIDSIRNAWALEKSLIPPEELARTKVVNNLKQLKEMLDAKIITDAEYITLKKKYLEKL